MAFSYAVLRRVGGDEWHVSVNDYAMTHESLAPSLDEAMRVMRRLIDQAAATPGTPLAPKKN